MLAQPGVGFAGAADAQAIAVLSRECIERGLGWSWRPPRVLASIRAADTNVVVTRDGVRVSAFGIMHYGPTEAYLALLAVSPSHRRQGLGTRIIDWLEETARVAGIGVVRLEALASNRAGRAFYRSLGYREIQLLPRHYQGREDGIRLAKDLWGGTGADPA